MSWKWAGIDGKGCANTTYISEFHPHIPKPWFRILFCFLFCIVVYFMCFETQNRVSRVLPWKCLTGVGYIDADWKVSTLEININFSLWTKSSKYEFQHLLTTKSSISGLWDLMGFEDFSFLSFPEFGFLKALAWELWLEDSEAGGTGSQELGEPVGGGDRYHILPKFKVLQFE